MFILHTVSVAGINKEAAKWKTNCQMENNRTCEKSITWWEKLFYGCTESGEISTGSRCPCLLVSRNMQ